ncbi:MAG: PEGA domain-containing protein [Polyangiaceae bacterium]
MYKTRKSSFFSLTALSLSASMVGLTFAPLASAQAAADAKPAKPAPAPAAKPAEAKPAAKPAADAKPATTKPDAKPAAAAAAPAVKPPDAKTREAARKAYSAGEKSFGENNFAAAHENFVKADALIPSPHAKYWVAKSLDKQDKTEEAIAAYEKAIGDAEAAKLGDDKLLDARTRVDELKAKLVAVISVVTTPPGATVLVDGNPEAGVTPLTLKLSPGAHKVTLSSTGFETKELDVVAKGGDKAEQKVELVAKAAPPPVAAAPVAETAPPPPPPPPPVEKRSVIPAVVTLGIAGAGAVVGTLFGLKALSAKSDFNDKPSTKAADDTERNALIADMAFGVAITLGVTGIVLLTSDDAPAESAKTTKLPFKIDVGGYAGKDRGGASAKITF